MYFNFLYKAGWVEFINLIWKFHHQDAFLVDIIFRGICRKRLQRIQLSPLSRRHLPLVKVNFILKLNMLRILCKSDFTLIHDLDTELNLYRSWITKGFNGTFATGAVCQQVSPPDNLFHSLWDSTCALIVKFLSYISWFSGHFISDTFGTFSILLTLKSCCYYFHILQSSSRWSWHTIIFKSTSPGPSGNSTLNIYIFIITFSIGKEAY